ncbi:MAG: bifunctional hydroxymethylpyrimidine kinase/phosphomethylpyrimidine kinase [Pyrinomonadaceae bacterium]|nr:bifunctional hydroxymethylpyrimidine kinase/phosphomethylpyrimidine kinase [Pyrinomonadaceae bacterium]
MGIELTSEQERLASIVARFAGRKVVVVGDLVADQFLYGEISRVSREAPVFILRHERTETVPGGAANCAVNLASLGARVSLLGVVGDDEAGRVLLKKLSDARVDSDGVIIVPGSRTTTKVRVLAGQAHSTRQQVIRVDYEPETLEDKEVLERLRARFHEEAEDSDAAIISDYNYGVACELVAKGVRDATQKRGIPVLVDSRFHLSLFPNFTSATPNEDEVEQLIGRKLADAASLKEAGAALREQLGYEALLITRGGRGLMLFEERAEPLQLDAVGASEPVDGTGAGDTVIAAYALAIASGATFEDAARLANHAGGLVVMKRGTASVNRAELLASIKGNN